MLEKLPRPMRLLLIIFLALFSVFIIFSLLVVILNFPFSLLEIKSFLFRESESSQNTEVTSSESYFEALLTSSTNPSFTPLELLTSSKNYQEKFPEIITLSPEVGITGDYNFNTVIIPISDGSSKWVHGVEIFGILVSLDSSSNVVILQVNGNDYEFSLTDSVVFALSSECEDIKGLCVSEGVNTLQEISIEVFDSSDFIGKKARLFFYTESWENYLPQVSSVILSSI